MTNQTVFPALNPATDPAASAGGDLHPGPPAQGAAEWRGIIAPYQAPDHRRALWQITNSFVPYLVLWYLMYRSLEISYLLTLGLAVVAAGFLLRIFILMHDCGHRSFLRSRRGSDILGFVAGILTFTPYFYWRYTHAIHHATVGNLDRRGVGDIWTMTVREYNRSSFWGRVCFRLYRNPFVLFVLGPVYMFLIHNRYADPRAGGRWQRKVQAANLAIAAMVVGLSAVLGLEAYLRLQIPVICISSAIGVWLFYVQHQFEGVRWARQADCDHFRTAMNGSSFYALPKVLQWFSGNIGFHHIHHLSSHIPNYFLDKCHAENPALQQVTTLGLGSSLKTMRYRLWDEERQQLVGVGVAWL